MIDLDPRWVWVEAYSLGRLAPVYLKVACRHLEIVPVTLLLTGETVARLCVTCDAQLPAV